MSGPSNVEMAMLAVDPGAVKMFLVFSNTTPTLLARPPPSGPCSVCATAYPPGCFRSPDQPELEPSTVHPAVPVTPPTVQSPRRQPTPGLNCHREQLFVVLVRHAARHRRALLSAVASGRIPGQCNRMGCQSG